MKINRTDRRPMIFHRWGGGLGSHRYPIGFSGDSWATFPTLAFQVYYNSTASNVAYGYWGGTILADIINLEQIIPNFIFDGYSLEYSLL